MFSLIQKFFEAIFGIFRRPGDARIMPPIPLALSHESFEIRVETSHVVKTSANSWHMVAAAKNIGQGAWQDLVLEAEFLDGETPLSVEREELQRGQAPLLQGDTLPIDIRMPCPEGATKVRATLKGDKGPAEAPQTKPVLTHERVKISERQHEVRWFGDGQNGFAHLTLEVENTGRALGLLKLRVSSTRKDGSVIDERTALPTYQGAPALLKGERRLVHVITRVPKDYGTYTVVVEEIEHS